MPTFTVHEPPPRKSESATNPERLVFVRDGFYFWAFVLTPFWLLAHRLWLAFFGYLVVSGLLGVLLYVVAAPGWVKFFTSLAIALLVGLEAASLWRWKLSRRWKTLGFVVADSAEMAERRFYAEWNERAKPAPLPEPKYASPVWRGAPQPSDVIGLFPEPGAPR